MQNDGEALDTLAKPAPPVARGGPLTDDHDVPSKAEAVSPWGEAPPTPTQNDGLANDTLLSTRGSCVQASRGPWAVTVP